MRFITVVAAAIILVFGLAVAVAPVAAEPIHDAALAGDVAELKRLLALGVKVDARDEVGQTPLHHAKTAEVVNLLLEAGARIDAREISAWTPRVRLNAICRRLLRGRKLHRCFGVPLAGRFDASIHIRTEV